MVDGPGMCDAQLARHGGNLAQNIAPVKAMFEFDPFFDPFFRLITW
jgi:hypothetical protein